MLPVQTGEIRRASQQSLGRFSGDADPIAPREPTKPRARTTVAGRQTEQRISGRSTTGFRSDFGSYDPKFTINMEWEGDRGRAK